MNPIIFILICLVLFGCNDSTTKSTHEQPQAEGSNKLPAASSQQIEVYPPSLNCKTYLKPATSNLQRYIVFQAIDFSPTEPDCWTALKNHGMAICKYKFPCRIIYIENDKLGSYKKDPFYPDFDALKKFGVAEFVKMENGWQLSGADANGWERNAEGFDYLADE